MSRPPCAAEREIVLTVADDESAWHVHTDSARLTRRLLRVAHAWGAEVERVGQGYQFSLPLRALRFAGPPTQAELAQRRQAAQKARNRAGKARAPRDFGRSSGTARGEIPARPADAQDAPVRAVLGVSGEGAGA